MKLLKRKEQPITGRQRISSKTGKSSAPVYSYRASRSDQDVKTGRQLQREETIAMEKQTRRGRYQSTELVITSILVLILLVSILTLSSKPKIVSVVVPGTDQTFLQDQTVYQVAAAKLFAGSIWNGNKITVNTNAISQHLLQEFPELASATVTLPLFTRQPIVYIQSTQPSIILDSTNGSFVVDSNGKALAPSSQIPSLAKLDLPTVTDQSSLTVTLDQQTLTSSEISFIQTVLGQLKAHDITYGSLTLPAASQELDVQISGEPYFVKFNLANSNANQQVGTFLATQAYLKSNNINPASYIDVRVDGRTYYK